MNRLTVLVPVLSALVAAHAADPTAATYSAGSVVEDTTLVLPASSLAASIADADGDPVAVTAVAALSAKGGKVRMVDGRIIYTPPANYVGPDSFTYTVREGVRVANFPTPATLATVSGVTIQNSGFGSAIALVPGTTDTFWALTDRGPNIDGNASTDKIFPVPSFQPNLVKFQVTGSTITILSTVGLKSDTAAAVTGLPPSTTPNASGGAVDTARAIDGTTDLGQDANGIDSEGLAVTSDGKFWVSDEYGPFLVRFAADGTTEERITPFAANGAGHRLPAVFGKRRPNRGMEGLCLTPSGKLVGVMQSPLFNGLSSDTANSVNNRVLAVRVLWYDPATGNSKQFIHVLDRATAGAADVAISEVAAIDEDNFYVLERDGEFPSNTTVTIQKKVWKFSLTGATDVSTKATSGLVDGAAFTYSDDALKGLLITAAGGTAKTIERVAEDATKAGSKATRAEVIAALTAVGITTTNRDATPKLDYATYGGLYTHDKIEGLTLVGTTLVTANDDDFGIVNGSGITLASKTILNSNPATTDYNQVLFVDLAKTGLATGSITVNVTSSGDNDVPSISTIADVTTVKGGSIPPISFMVSDPETAANKLTVSVASSNHAVVAASGWILGGSGAQRTLTITPVATATGTAQITVTVSDGTNSVSTGFRVLVTDTPYLIPKAPGVQLRTLLSVGDAAGYKADGTTPYRFVGLPDGLGAFDNSDGTFTVLVAHEASTDKGINRAHGNKGAFVSRWTFDKGTWTALAGADHNPNATSIRLWDTATTDFAAAGTTAFNRFCSADLAPVTAYYNATTGKGTQERIFLAGEETTGGRLFAHVATGSAKGTSWELAHHGKYAFENALACPKAQDKTIVAGMDDSDALPSTGAPTTPSEVWFYVGTKASSGSDVVKAGLVGGKLYGVQAKSAAGAAITTEERTNALGYAKGVAQDFALVQSFTDGNASAKTAVELQAEVAAKSITIFSRVEDGAWDPSNPADFYFATTDRFDSAKNGGSGATAQTGRSRLWRLRFTDIANPENGGKLTLLIDGSEDAGPQMMDNLCVDTQGRILIQEDPGNQDASAKIWLYQISTGALVEIARHDPARFGDRVAGATTAPTAPFSKDEESSGIMDAGEILGQGWYLLDVQAHQPEVGFDSELIERGQLLAMYVPGNITAIAPNAAGGGTTTAATPTQTNSTAYLVPSSSTNALGLTVKPLLTVGESVNLKPDGVTPYRLVGLPDGLGLAANGDGTWTLAVAHEAGATVGSPRAHGNKGAFVSRWTLDANGVVLRGEDHNPTPTSINLWTGNGWTAGTTAFTRFCSADLAAASAFKSGSLGTSARILLNGEETTGGRVFAHIVSGGAIGSSWQLPRLGLAAWENVVASPFAQTKTIVAGLDDSDALPSSGVPAEPSEVFIYVGTKQATGNDIEKAGLTNGKLYGVQAKTAAGAVITTEARTNGLGVANGVAIPFGLVALGSNGDVTALDAAAQQADVTAKQITTFSRVEDGAWDPSAPADFYFVTTDRFDTAKNGGSGAATATVGRSRLWRLRFTDISAPESGGTVTMLIDGSEDPGPQMMDNLCIDKRGRIILQEDPGNQLVSARVWMYSIAAGTVIELFKHDPARFGDRVTGTTTAATAPFTADEESSGVIDASDLLGAGWFLLDVQAHGTGSVVDTELIERGQLVAVKIPDSGSTAGTPIAAAEDDKETDLEKCGKGSWAAFITLAGVFAGLAFWRRRR